MKTGRLSAAVLAASLLVALAAPARASVLVDTGAPIGGSGGYTLFNDGAGQFQWLANRFSVGAADTITDIAGFIGGGAGTLTIALYGDGPGIPGAELHAGQVAYDGVEGFEGLSGLNWAVAAGAYWVAFEVRAGDTLDGFMSFNAVPNPQTLGAFANGSLGPGYMANDIQIGLRIEGSGRAAGNAPEPAAWALMIAGFSLAGAALRRRRALAAQL